MRRIFWGAPGPDLALGRPFRVNRSLIDEHDGDVIFDGINAVAFHAFQALFIRGELHVCFAYGAGENFEKLRIYGHVGSPRSEIKRGQNIP
jgi:hypothetical protein